jgi:hypothetical protein
MIRSPALRAARSAMVAVGSMKYLGLLRPRIITGAEGRGYASDKLYANISPLHSSRGSGRDVSDALMTLLQRDLSRVDHTGDTTL